MGKIPEWQYPLYKDNDNIAYKTLQRLGKSGKYPEIIGSRKEVGDFLKLLILSQKSKDYRKFRDVVVSGLKKNELDTSKILSKSHNILLQNADKTWAVFMQDKRICKMIDDLSVRKIEFIGTDREIVEFSIRFILSQLLQDWRGPLMAVLTECKEKKVNISKLNSLLKIWDYTKIFQN
ncbi:hypothetical protein HYZ41_04805 [archaeon]|nr:hypothetical protein [archaeon]